MSTTAWENFFFFFKKKSKTIWHTEVKECYVYSIPLVSIVDDWRLGRDEILWPRVYFVRPVFFLFCFIDGTWPVRQLGRGHHKKTLYLLKTKEWLQYKRETKSERAVWENYWNTRPPPPNSSLSTGQQFHVACVCAGRRYKEFYV